MASIALMIGGAILNATAFVGGNYLAKSLSGANVDEEKVRHDKAVEKYLKRSYFLFRKETLNQIEQLEQNIEEEQQQIDDLGRRNEEIRERMLLPDRIREILKKYGFTAFSILSVVGLVIVSKLRTGLSRVAAGVGNGLKALGKKLEKFYQVL